MEIQQLVHNQAPWEISLRFALRGIRQMGAGSDHDWMLKFLEHRIADQRMLRLIGKWFKAGVIEGARRVAATKGTPQGVFTPLLANIYLHYVLDQWTQQWRGRHARGAVSVVRSADDSVFGFQNGLDANGFLAEGCMIKALRASCPSVCPTSVPRPAPMDAPPRGLDRARSIQDT